MTDEKQDLAAHSRLIKAYLDVAAEGIERVLAYWQSNLPDLKKQPATSKLVAAYVQREEFQLTALRGGAAALLEQGKEFPRLSAETNELSSWLDSSAIRAKIIHCGL